MFRVIPKADPENDNGRDISTVDLMLRHSCLGAASHHRAFLDPQRRIGDVS